LNAKEAILDGEIVALDQQGVPRFQLLQSRLGRKNTREIQRLASKSRIAFYIFDLIYLDGFDLTRCALLERKNLLESLLKPSNNLRFSEHIVGEGEKLFQAVVQVPLEGIVAKRLDSTYTQRRSREWLKVKSLRQAEVVVGGYTAGRGAREYFGALVVGLYKRNELHYVAHIGGGFDQFSLEQLFELMQPLRATHSPFVEEPVTNEAVQWIEPGLVVRVKFTEWTADARLRQPVFLGLSREKSSRDCVFEE